jgi:DNA uptake protein ComE-like DNA-binding protein
VERDPPLACRAAGLSHVDDPRLKEAEQRLAQRERALRVARENPSLALEAGIGRPDVRGAFHGEVVDLNNAGAGAIAGLPGISHRLALRITSVRDRVGSFSSLEDLGLVLDADGETVERLRGLIVFLPRQKATYHDDQDLDDAPAAPP